MINRQLGPTLLIKPVNGQWPLFVYDSDGVIPISTERKGLHQIYLSNSYSRRTYYVDILIDSMTGAYPPNHNHKFWNGYSNFYMDRSFVYGERSGDILLMGVGCKKFIWKPTISTRINYQPEIIYISDEFDTPKCHNSIRSVRSSWRKAMAVAKDRGIRVEKIPQKEINRFLTQFNWQPGLAAADILENTAKGIGIQNLYLSIPS